MLSIRLQRAGRRHDPAHRIVVQDSTQSPKSGRYVELLGSYNPRGDAPSFDTERARYWVSQGAYVSPTVHNLFVDAGVVDTKKVNPLPQKQPIQSEESEESESADAAATGSEGGEDAAADTEAAADGGEEDADNEAASSEDSAGETESQDGQQEAASNDTGEGEQAAGDTEEGGDASGETGSDEHGAETDTEESSS